MIVTAPLASDELHLAAGLRATTCQWTDGVVVTPARVAPRQSAPVTSDSSAGQDGQLQIDPSSGVLIAGLGRLPDASSVIVTAPVAPDSLHLIAGLRAATFYGTTPITSHLAAGLRASGLTVWWSLARVLHRAGPI